jgi:hypothetical protein
VSGPRRFDWCWRIRAFRPALVNNLNLMVTAPDGTRFVGNQAQSGSVTLDSANNVDAVSSRASGALAWWARTSRKGPRSLRS